MLSGFRHGAHISLVLSQTSGLPARSVRCIGGTRYVGTQAPGPASDMQCLKQGARTWSSALHVSVARLAAAGVPATKHFGKQRPSRESEPPKVALQVSYTPSEPASASAASVGSHFRSDAASFDAAHVSWPY